MIKDLWKLLIKSLEETETRIRTTTLVLLIGIGISWYALAKSRYEVKDGKDEVIHELRSIISANEAKIFKSETKIDSLIDMNGKLGIKIVMDSVKANTKIIDLNQKFIEQQNEIKKKLK